MVFLNIAWWFLYACTAVLFQCFTVGVDFLLPGIIVALQERKFFQFMAVFCFFILLQEGMGTMPFGNVLLWYLLVIIFFYAWQWFFEVESFIFIILLSAALAVSHYYIVSILATVQDIYINEKSLRDECFYQLFLTPFIWHMMNYLRRGVRYAQ